MKSNQERSNECLPPKKREIPASTLPSDERPVMMAPASESQRTGNLAWLASVASGQESGSQRTGTPAESDGPQYKPLVEYSTPCSTQSTRSATAVTTVPAVYTSPLSQHGGTIQYTPLPPNLHFISPSYAAPYTGYVSPLVPPSPASIAATTTSQRHTDAYTSATNSPLSKSEQHHHTMGRPPGPSMLDSAAQPHSTQYVQISASRTVPSPHGHLPLHLHPQHTLALSGPSQVLLQYADAPALKKEEARPREVLNGEMDKGQRFSLSESSAGKQGKGASSSQQHHIHQQQHYEARHVVLPAEYAHDSSSGLRTSLVLVPNSHTSSSADPGGTLEDKLPPPPTPGKGGICAGKPITRTPSSSLSSTSLPFPPPPLPVDGLKAAVTTLSPHTVIHTTHNATEPLSLGLTSTNFYPAHQPIIGYIAGTGQQPPLSYHTNLPPHLVIPGAQPVIIPVSSAEATATSTATATAFPTALPHAFVTSTPPKGETFESLAPYPHPAGAMVQAQLHLPMVPAPASLLATPPPPSAPSLPPYFIKGSIIQLADGELKRVEDLKTEDFIQSAEISSELKIDSSTVERIDSSHTPNYAIIQFAVGEHRSQVSVEVLVEYPFFVFGQGWSSCCPDRTTQLLELPCAKLSVGDVCISLTLKNLKNGSLKKSQGQIPDTPSLGPPLKPPKPPSGGTRGGVRHTEQENGLGQCGGQGGPGTQASAENGELRFGERGTCKAPQQSSEAESISKPPGRKRRWSAPEGRKVEKPEEEPPLTLPKPSFIPQEVKISIEGRSNNGK
ncbi:ataxin-1a [Salminus brasiliensis]|uniref:ataxin-1a n=1 Tax=Salminus brasiliensis TaxID=930266 RepID=UPI003B830F59